VVKEHGMELDRNSIQAGTPVYSSDDEHVGDVEDVGATYIRARKGWFFVKERYIPFTAIVRTDVDGVYLSVAKDQLDAMAWDAPPAETDVTATDTAGIYDTRGADTTAAQRPRTTDRDAGGAPVATGDTVRGERVAGSQVSNTLPAAFQEGMFEVRARREELTVSTQARVIEELVVTAQAVERVQTIQETVRRTQVDITEIAQEATTATVSNDLTSMRAESTGSGTAAGGAYIASTPETSDVSEEAGSKPQPRNRRRRLR
jgi:hypothetical protein